MSEKINEGMSLLDKVRAMNKHGDETEVIYDYRQRLTAGAKKAHLGEGPGVIEIARAEKLRRAAVREAEDRPLSTYEETPLDKTIRDKLISVAKNKETKCGE